MDEQLMMRLDLLLNAGAIDEEIIQIIKEFIEIIKKELSFTITEKNGSMLVNHMAMALARIKKGEEILPMEDVLFEEVKTSAIYSRVPSIINELEEKFNIEIPESEFGYIALHLCNLNNLQN
ncbi:PRD domain-containing protein [Tepidimicrobium xylanilyticum]|uniref:PRD domain-containing protein n=1 Tax=Tepidimicrobium xylanilyticum TaxID=1123352 RepID=A0A1H2RHF7_9FIRM|nr:PRD domain-containing protein [Tepidimicrobium xylanilyticum]GMG95438.1 hypothetical protein EN5CB1_02640 [Tepidimicrobium xylanilyticum]SDW18234.1 PRD domain-containing protein [Tepidimicrobium xylanilyticum]